MTVTVNEHMAEPAVLVAVQVTVVMPLGKAKGEVMVVGPGMVQVTVGTGHPTTVVENVLVAVHTPGSVVVTMSAGQVIVGTVMTGVTVG